jgi:hypothetical protein
LVVIGSVTVIAGVWSVFAAVILLGVVLIAAGWCVAAGFVIRPRARRRDRRP